MDVLTSLKTPHMSRLSQSVPCMSDGAQAAFSQEDKLMDVDMHPSIPFTSSPYPIMHQAWEHPEVTVSMCRSVINLLTRYV